MVRSGRIRVAVVAGIAVVVFAGIALAVYRKAPTEARGGAPGRVHDFGEVVQGEVVEHIFTLRNEETHDLRIRHVTSAYGGSVTVRDSAIPADGETTIRARLDTRHLRGRINDLIRVEFATPENRAVWLQLGGRVVLPVELAPRDRVYFFTVKGEAPSQDVLVINHQDRPLKILGVASSNPLFRVRVEDVKQGGRYRIAVALDSTTAVGRHQGVITVTTDSPDHPSLEIAARAFVEDVVSTSLSTVNFDQIMYERLDRPVIGEQVVLVKKHRGTGFKVLRATTDLPYLDVTIVPRKDGASFLVNLKIVQRRATRGEIRGTLVIETNDPAFRELRLPITGRIL